MQGKSRTNWGTKVRTIKDNQRNSKLPSFALVFLTFRECSMVVLGIPMFSVDLPASASNYQQVQHFRSLSKGQTKGQPKMGSQQRSHKENLQQRQDLSPWPLPHTQVLVLLSFKMVTVLYLTVLQCPKLCKQSQNKLKQSFSIACFEKKKNSKNRAF